MTDMLIAIIILLIWVAVWQFIFNATLCDNQGFILKQIDELKRKLEK